MNSSRKLLLPLLAVAVAGCGEQGGAGTEPERPEPGALTVSLSVPAQDARAVVLSLSGPDSIAQVEGASSSYTVFSRGAAKTRRVAVFGPLATGALLRLHVSDVKQVGGYTATIVEVADTANRIRENLEGYTVRVQR